MFDLWFRGVGCTCSMARLSHLILETHGHPLVELDYRYQHEDTHWQSALGLRHGMQESINLFLFLDRCCNRSSLCLLSLMGLWRTFGIGHGIFSVLRKILLEHSCS